MKLIRLAMAVVTLGLARLDLPAVLAPPLRGGGNIMFRSRAALSLLFISLLLVCPLTQASITPPRIALVIGNGAYTGGVGPLSNPVHDATDIADTLRTLGFQVTLLHNADKRKMKEAVGALSKELHSGGVGLFYFAGHGVQVKGQNYLIPIRAAIAREADVEYEAVEASWILDTMQEGGNELNIVILDACRDNPLARSLRSAQRGLAAMQAGKGALIAYSTAPGTQAFDGEGKNSPYAKYLLQYLQEPGLGLEGVFKKVRAAVAEETRNQQIPWESTSVTGDFYFASPPAIASLPVAPQEPPRAADNPSSALREPSQTVTDPSSTPQEPSQAVANSPSIPQEPPLRLSIPLGHSRDYCGSHQYWGHRRSR